MQLAGVTCTNAKNLSLSKGIMYKEEPKYNTRSEEEMYH
jgi:hypothetical protein